MFHKEGAQSILLGTVLTAIVLLLSDKFIDTNWIKMTVQITTLLLLIIILQFFRNPKRNFILDENQILSPVDGKVVVIENKTFGEILSRQIAGALAKRIVNYAKEGMQVVQGEDAGFIKFGSRVDLFLPLGTTINVALNQKAVGGKTIIATKANG